MELPMRSGKARRVGRLRSGFTLIEMMIVMAIIVILIAVAVPFYQKAIIRAKESVLHNNLFAMRTAIDEYSFDKQKAPQSSAGSGDRRLSARCAERSDHAEQRYWKIIMEDAGQAVNSSEPGIFDIRSGSNKIGARWHTLFRLVAIKQIG